MRPLLLLVLLSSCATPQSKPVALPPEAGDESNAKIEAATDRELASLVALYKEFHAAPELSLKEEKTSKKFAEQLAGWKVFTNLGGFGVAAILKNGDGPTLLVRIDMDGLPVKEETGLPYAATGDAMHACGHDIHMATGIGVARLLPTLKEFWSGTVLLIGQPAEEVGKGAKRMIADPRFAEVIAESGTPQWCLSLHDTNGLPAGEVGLCAGWAAANVDSVDITIFGKGGHGAAPHQTIDPIVIASEVVLSLQTIVSRRLKPGTPAVVSVGSIHGGTKHNIIPNEVKLQLTVRSYEERIRTRLLDEIRQTTEAICTAHHAPKPPEIVVDPDAVPAEFHDPAMTDRLAAVFRRQLGGNRVKTLDPIMGGEDFGFFGRHFKTPYVQIWIGAVDPDLWKAGAEIPALHSSKWAPLPEPTIRTAVMAMTRGCVELLAKPK